MTRLKREQHMLLMDNMDGTLANHCYTTDDSNDTLQAPKGIENQKYLTSSLTILTCPRHPQQMQHQFHHQN